MSTRLQIRRGLASILPVLAEGEPGFTTDSKEFYVGSSTGNIQLSKKADLDAHVSATMAHAWGQIGETPTTLEEYGITDAYTKTAIDAALALKAPLASPGFTGNVGINNALPGHPLSIGNADVFGLRRDSSDVSIRFGDNSGWKFHIGRAKEASGGSINTGSAGTIMTVRDNGAITMGFSDVNSSLNTHVLTLKGAAISDGTSNYGSYGSMLLDANSGFTSGARKFLITNAYSGGNFAIIRSTNATTNPSLGTNGALSSGYVDFTINNNGYVGVGGAPTGKFHVVDGGTTSTVICLIEADDNNPWHLSIMNKAFTSSPSRGFNFIQENGGAGNIYVDNKSMLQINPTSMCIAPGLIDNAVSCGSSSVRWSGIWAATSTIQTSDERAKNSITESDLGLDFINQLMPVSYKFNVRLNEITKEPDGTETVIITPAVLDEDGNEIEPAVTEERQKYKEVVTPLSGVRTHYGMIAQQVQQVLDGKDFAGFIYDQETDSYGLRYEEFIAPLIKAVQELKAIVDAQAAEIEQLKSGA